MKNFIQKYEANVTGVLSGFDRLVFRGTLRALAVVGGAMDYLWRMGVLLKDFGAHVEQMTERLKAASLDEARRLSRPIVYLASSATSKEETARQIARKDGIREGLIGVLTAVEPCRSYMIYRDRSKKELVLKRAIRKGLQLYHYWMDKDFGLMHGRISTWFPFPIQIGLNGREWLGRRMDAKGIRYTRRENSFPWIEDMGEAQRMMDQMQRLTWPEVLRDIGRRLNPAHEAMFDRYRIDYYWVVHQSEWASDVMFEKRSTVERLYPLLTRGAMEAFSAKEVMRFFGKKPWGRFAGEVVSDHRRWEEGVRVKHQVKGNSVKSYDKGSILRAETTINAPREFQSYHCSERDPKGQKKWLPMRQGVADLYRRAEVSQAANERYLDALAALSTDRPLREWVEPVCRVVRWKGRRVRAIRPWSEPDRSLLAVVNDGAWCLNGFRQRDLMSHLYPKVTSDPVERRRISGRLTRYIRLLRAHGLIRKVSGTYRYHVTDTGRQVLTAILQYQHLSLQQITDKAA